MTISPGTRLGPYEILAPLGAGGMGEVYRARDTRLERMVAVKVLPPLLSSSPDARQRFEREARAISKLSHPNIFPGSIAVGPDGNIWFTSPQENLIRSITTSGKLTKTRIPADAPAGIALGPDGAIWFTEAPNGIGRIEVPRRSGR